MHSAALPAAMIYPRQDARPLIRSRVEDLATSIQEIGLINPVVVRKAMRIRNGVSVEAWEILAGCHRYEACAVKLGMETVPCLVREDDDLRAELVMIDENLCRADLTPAQEALQTSRRKELYEMLHPETVHGMIGGGHSQSRQFGDSASRFTADTAERTGRSERAIQRDAARGRALGDDLNRIAGTSLDRGVELDALARLPPEQREDIVKRAQSGERVSARKVVDIPEQEDREQIEAKKKRKLMTAWNDCPPAVQQWFVDHVQVGLIMDERFGQ